MKKFNDRKVETKKKSSGNKIRKASSEKFI